MQAWVVVDDKIGLSQQCKLAGVARATYYDKKRRLQDKVNEGDLILLSLLDAEYTRHPFYGSRRMTVWLRLSGYRINRKRVQRLMQRLGLAGMAPGPSTSTAHPQQFIVKYRALKYCN